MYGGTDCDDMDITFNPGIVDTWYDGFDSNCDGISDGEEQAAGTNPLVANITEDDAKSGCSSVGNSADKFGFMALLSLVGIRRRSRNRSNSI